MAAVDFYEQCETGLKSALQSLTTVFLHDWQVSNDDTVIARGGDVFAILRPGAFPIFAKQATGKQVDFDWGITVDVYVRYESYATSWAKFKTVRAEMIWRLGCDPTLGNTPNVWGVTLSAEEGAQYFKFAESSENATPNFIIQTMQATVRQRVEFEF